MTARDPFEGAGAETMSSQSAAQAAFLSEGAPDESEQTRQQTQMHFEAQSQVQNQQQIDAHKLDQAESEAGSFDIPRPLLTIQQAAVLLGKSVRALERSLLGRWGNKLPEGWSARKVKTESGDDWRIVPPPGFRLRSQQSAAGQLHETASERGQAYSANEEQSLNSAYFMPARKNYYRSEHSFEQPTIVIDRSEEVEHLLRELLSTQKALSEERRLHMEDLRIVAQLQGSMRLLETNAAENSRTKTELETARQQLEELKQEYNEVLRMPWWKRLFSFRRR